MVDTHQSLLDTLAVLQRTYVTELGAVRGRHRAARLGVQDRCAKIGHIFARDESKIPTLFPGDADAGPKRTCVVCGADE